MESLQGGAPSSSIVSGRFLHPSLRLSPASLPPYPYSYVDMSVAHSSAHAEHQYDETFARPAIALDEDSKIDSKEQANLSAEQLDYLRVDDAELVGGLTFNQLSLFEKKSVLVRRPFPVSFHRAKLTSYRPPSQINKEMDTLVRVWLNRGTERPADVGSCLLFQNEGCFWGLGRYQVRPPSLTATYDTC